MTNLTLKEKQHNTELAEEIGYKFSLKWGFWFIVAIAGYKLGEYLINNL